MFTFLHIPKTAGTTFRALLENRFLPEQRHLYSPMKAVLEGRLGGLKGTESKLEAALSCRRGPQLVYGHMFAAWPEELWSRSLAVTFLRDPVERVLSNYFYRKEHGHFSRKAVSLEEYIRGQCDSFAMQCEADNLQARLLSLNPYTARAVRFGRYSETMFARAESALSKFAMVGLTEQFEKSISLFGKLGLGRFEYKAERHRVSTADPMRENVAQAIREEIALRNIFDARLYIMATRRFENGCARFSELSRI